MNRELRRPRAYPGSRDCCKEEKCSPSPDSKRSRDGENTAYLHESENPSSRDSGRPPLFRSLSTPLESYSRDESQTV